MTNINKYNLKLYSTLTVLFFCLNISAQTFKPSTEIGFSGGVSYYIGDLNSSHFNSAKPAISISAKRNLDRRFSIKAELKISSISADDRISSDAINLDRGLHYKSNLQELSGQIEFNFLEYEIGNPAHKWSPFLFTGITIFNFNPLSENSNGEWVELQPLGTEGQGTTAYPQRKEYSRTQWSIPMGGGLKLSLSESFNILFSFSMNKTFTDYLDDVSLTYPGNPTEFTNLASEMSDPTNSHDKDEQRGDEELKNDWYSFTAITFSFKLPGLSKGCDY
jgi:hypothetical protein|tara:strand:+ start:5229 stop:6059 length:831 start_codon:yes stop_codon:yes gene_type:complete